MFRKLLVANRGEIACRILQACRELGIKTVAVYSQVDANSLHVRLADEAVCIGPAPNRDSYLNIANIMSAAVVTGAEAIHPGYGNLSEVARFAEVCEACKIAFVGPPSSIIERMGDKAAARSTMMESGVPVVPGSDGPVKDDRDARAIADELGYPVMVKAVGGGGGRGIRVAHNGEQLEALIGSARAEARAAFGNDELYVEKFVGDARHIEVQILADSHGNTVHLGERDCSIQHRHQKLLEEAPAFGVSDSLRRRLGEAALAAARAVGYINAGTIEFILDKDNKFYFIEMNTRIQVEHPVTEMLTGVDIVREQIRVAAGEKLSCEQGKIWFNGHAIECRVLAADGERGFTPSPGIISEWRQPLGPGIRVDTGVGCGSEISSYYDPMIAKVIAWDQTREAAVRRMSAALEGMRVSGLRTTIPYHQRILQNAFFRRGEVDVNFIKRHMTTT
ncbi:MAG TPA: acetyl-CoA carboxylase biotin carboxylase subunit [Armatimonadetes bacterium]|jgi:acetyl-CoA carboxylase biotin carboxylase subunit|nr:acetyl-CoA carboxylase biotin carboxylase subunit [Armatimonadota bacterium]